MQVARSAVTVDKTALGNHIHSSFAECLLIHVVGIDPL
jgi:hypothetical protein